MSVYRVHAGGVWSSKNRLYTVEQDIIFYSFLDNLFQAPEVKRAIHIKQKNAYQKYSIELAKVGKVFKSLVFLKKALNSSLSTTPSQKKIVTSYLIVLASKIKQVIFPFLPPLSSIKNLKRR